MLYEEITGSILESAFVVANELGSGFLESVYEKAMVITLREKKLTVETQKPISVIFHNQNVGDFFADILVEGKVIVELKAVKSILPEHQAQVINYLKATGYEVGLLINFGSPRIEYKRLTRYKDI